MEAATFSLNTRPIIDDNSLPLLVESHESERPSTSELVTLLTDRREWLEKKILLHGGILLRGFAVQCAEDLDQVAKAVLLEVKPYIEGQSPRTRVRGNLYTSTEYPECYRVALHSELSYAKEPPHRIIFYCHRPATSGGETPIVDCRIAYCSMPADLRNKFETKQVMYVKNMHGEKRGLGKSWMEHFETANRKDVERYLQANDISYEWNSNGTLRTFAIRPAVRRHAETGETVWYNQANLWHSSNFEPRRRNHLLRLCGEDGLPTQAYFGDGSPITDEELECVRNVLWEKATIFPWQHGDVLILDNFLVAHGRMPYEGPRKILVAMG